MKVKARKLYTTGPLKGITVTEEVTHTDYTIGHVYRSALHNAMFLITALEPINASETQTQNSSDAAG